MKEAKVTGLTVHMTEPSHPGGFEYSYIDGQGETAVGQLAPSPPRWRATVEFEWSGYGPPPEIEALVQRCEQAAMAGRRIRMIDGEKP